MNGRIKNNLLNKLFSKNIEKSDSLPFIVRGAGGCVAIAMSILSVQDYFDEWSLYFTWAFIACIALCIFLIFLSSTGISSCQPRYRQEKITLILASIWVIGCAICGHFFRQFHSELLIGGISIASALISAFMFAFMGSSGWVSSLPVIASYILMMSSPVFYMDHQIYPRWGTVESTVVLCCYATILIPVFFTRKGIVALFCFLVAGTALRIIGIMQWEIDPAHRDMIPLIHYANLSFLHGNNPYRLYWCGHDLPLTYFPVLWLSYLPAVIADIPPRTISVLLSIASTIVIYLWKGKNEKLLDLVLYFCAIWFFQMEGMWVAMFAESPPFWLLTFLFLLAFRHGKKFYSALLLGLMLASRHFSLLIFPYALLYLLYEKKDGKNFDLKNIFYPLMAVTLAAVIILPFLVKNATGFWYGTLHWLGNFGTTHKNWWEHEVSLAPVFYSRGKEKILPLIQAGGFISIFILFFLLWKNQKFNTQFLITKHWIFLTMSYFFFLLFNTLVWRHLYLMPVGILCFTILQSSFPEAHEKVKEQSSFLKTKWFPMLISLQVLVSAISGAFIIRSLIVFLDKKGFAKDTETILKQVQQGDLLVDNVFFNAWPILEGTPFDLKKLNESAVHSFRLRSQFPPIFKRVIVATSGSHFVIPYDTPDLLTYMEMNPPQKIGKLKVFTFNNPLTGEIVSKLSENMNWISSVEIQENEKKLIAINDNGRFHFDELDPRYGIEVVKLDILLADRSCILWSAPVTGVLKVEIQSHLEGRFWLQTAIADRAIWPGLETVEYEAKIKNNSISFSQPNEQGFYVWHLGYLENGEKLILKMHSKRKKQRFFCFDIITTLP